MAQSMIWRYANAEERRVERLDVALRSLSDQRVKVLTEELRQERLLQIEHHRSVLEFLTDTNEARLQYKIQKYMVDAAVDIQELQEPPLPPAALELLEQPFDYSDHLAEPLE